jgi:hypothetical protein
VAKKSAAQGESPFEDDREIEIEPAGLPDVSDPKPPKKKKKKRKGKGSDRGVETMFRTSYRTHLALSSLADAKANIMISINGIIISILLATVYPSVTQSRWLIIPSSILLLSALVSLVFAVISARPRVTHNTVTLEDVRENKANILFFGTFVNMTEEDFISGMWELMGKRKRIYTNMMRDLFGLGAVLKTKYRLLRISYTVFMFGLSVGVISYLAVLALVGSTAGGL